MSVNNPFKSYVIKYLDSNFRHKGILLFLTSLEVLGSPFASLLRMMGFEVIYPLKGLNHIMINRYQDQKKYVQIQTKTNEFKRTRVFASEENIDLICSFIRKRFNDKPINLLCHGTRNGFEQKIFRKYLPVNSEVVGSELSSSAFDYADTVVWDFNILNPDWENKFDVLYSNSHDHSFNLRDTLQVWINSLNENGIIILEHSIAHEWFKKSEPSALKFETLPFLLLDWFKGQVFVSEIFNAPKFHISSIRHKIFVISKNSQL
jgi:hypothetical protein